MAREINSNDSMIDIRDVIERFEELRDERQGLEEAIEENRRELDEAENDYTDAANDETTVLDDALQARDAAQEALTDALDALNDWSEQVEHDSLKSLLDELKGYGGDEQFDGDWYPVSLIADSHFEDYARDLADEIGAINRDMSWPYTCIDWERAARELQQDYSSVEWDGNTFWYR